MFSAFCLNRKEISSFSSGLSLDCDSAVSAFYWQTPFQKGKNLGWKMSNFHGCLAAGAGLAGTAQPCARQIAGFGPSAALARGVNMAGAVWVLRGRAGDSVTSLQPSVPFPSMSSPCTPPVLAGLCHWAGSAGAQLPPPLRSRHGRIPPPREACKGCSAWSASAPSRGAVVAGYWPRSGHGAARRT